MLRPNTTHCILALLVTLLILGLAPRGILLVGGPAFPGSDRLSSPLPIFLLSMLVNVLLLWRLTVSRRSIKVAKAEQREKQYEALHDPLTGTANRRSFESRLRELIQSENPAHALLMIDLDNFKPVNDIYGHAAGDQILCEISAGIKALSRGRDLVCRLGGDEFAVLLTDADLETTERISCELLDYVINYRMLWKGHRVQVGTSVGVVLIDKPNLNAENILEAADVALYAAKEAGRAAVMLIDISTDGEGQQQISADMARRVDPGAPEPTHSANSHRPSDGSKQILKGIATVSRPENKQERRANSRRGDPGPKHWMTVEPVTLGDGPTPGMTTRELVNDAQARSDGGADLARWTFAMALSAVSVIRPEKLASVGIAVPIPARSLIAVPELAEEFAKALALTSNPIKHLTLVLQNTEKVQDTNAIKAFIERMHQSRVRVAFQIRTTSFDHVAPLTHAPFDEIHISREVHRNIKPGTSAYTSIKALRSIAENAGAILVANEVDNKTSLQYLVELEIQRISGSAVGPSDMLDAALFKLLKKAA